MTSLWQLCRRLHRNQRGAVSLETILIVGAIALPILLFLLKVGWPRIRAVFDEGLIQMESEAPNVYDGGGGAADGGGVQ